VSVRSEGRRGPPATVDYTITVPAWMGLDLSGVYTDVKVAGVRAPITVETVQGEVDVAGGEGTVSLRSVQGSVKLQDAKGRIDVHSVNEEVRVSNASGEITAETVNGDVVLEQVDATSLDATTVNGDSAMTVRSGTVGATHSPPITATSPWRPPSAPTPRSW
jgi:Uncharacterized conserved protein